MTDYMLKNHWYVLHTKSRFENVTTEGLEKKSFNVFLPKVLVRSKRKDRKAMIHIPLFPGYLFIKTDLLPDTHLAILKTVGAVRLIGGTEGPTPVPDETVESLKIIVETQSDIITGTGFARGDKVQIVSGHFAGVSGIFERIKGMGRVVVHIEALGQFAAIDVNEYEIEKLPGLL